MAQGAVKPCAEVPRGQMVTSKRKHAELSISKKKEVLDLLQDGKSQRELAKLFNVSKSAIFNVKSHRAKIIEAWERNFASDRKRLKRSTVNDELNEKIWTFFVECRSKNIPITGTMLQERARLFADTLGIDSFKASNGWLGSFMRRHNIVTCKFNGDSEGDVYVGQDANNIHVVVNKDESGMSVRQPRKFLVLKQETYKGGVSGVPAVEEDCGSDDGATCSDMPDVITGLSAVMRHKPREEGSDRDCEEDCVEEDGRCDDSAASSEMSDAITSLSAVLRHQHREEGRDPDYEVEAGEDLPDEPPLRRQDALILVKELQRFALQTQPELLGTLVTLRRAIEEGILMGKSKAEQRATVSRILNRKK